MSKQIAKSFEVKFGERVTIRATGEIWEKLDTLAKSRDQSLERLIQDAEKVRPFFILRPDWLNLVVVTRGGCCKYYKNENGVMSMKAKVTIPDHMPIPASATPHEVVRHLVDNASWHVPVVPMREMNSNEVVDFILSSKLLQASPRNDVTGGVGGVYVVLSPVTNEQHLCLYSPTGKSFVFDLEKMPDRLMHLMEDLSSDYEEVASGGYVLKSKPFQSLRNQLGL